MNIFYFVEFLETIFHQYVLSAGNVYYLAVLTNLILPDLTQVLVPLIL